MSGRVPSRRGKWYGTQVRLTREGVVHALPMAAAAASMMIAYIAAFAALLHKHSALGRSRDSDSVPLNTSKAEPEEMHTQTTLQVVRHELRWCKSLHRRHAWI